MEIFKPSNKIIDLYQLVACLIGFVFYFSLWYTKKTRKPNTSALSTFFTQEDVVLTYWLYLFWFFQIIYEPKH